MARNIFAALFLPATYLVGYLAFALFAVAQGSSWPWVEASLFGLVTVATLLGLALAVFLVFLALGLLGLLLKGVVGDKGKVKEVADSTTLPY